MPTDMSEYQRGLTSPASDAKAVTTSDSADLPNGACRAVYVGTAGNLRVTTLDGTTLTISDVPNGVFPLSVSRVFATNTTASNIVALY